jgi:tRNA pseudouridine38-40 synthase
MRIALGIEYDGQAFAGWQTQLGVRTVQQLVEAAVSRVADEPVKVQCAGRTDAGVHATGQVLHFDTGAERSPRAWMLGSNAHLAADVAVTWAQAVEPDFHARFSATARRYCYVISNRAARPGLWSGRITWEPRRLDAARMAEAARFLLGEHDFTSFRAKGCQAKHPVRTLHRLDVLTQEDSIVLDVEANAFLQHMVRNLAGVLMEIGMGRREPVWAAEVLAARERALGGVTAPASGLYLTGVSYPARFGLPVSDPSPRFPGFRS